MKQASTSQSQQLLSTITGLCQALVNSPQPDQLIQTYFTPTTPRITEHGPSWARTRLPFLAKTFTGVAECNEYFYILSETLTRKMGEDTFPKPGSGGYVVDERAVVEGEEGKGVVSVVGKASFASKKTGKGWHEEFIYRFSGFDEQGRIGHWEIWADPLSAWVAVGGEDVE